MRAALTLYGTRDTPHDRPPRRQSGYGRRAGTDGDYGFRRASPVEGVSPTGNHRVHFIPGGAAVRAKGSIVESHAQSETAEFVVHTQAIVLGEI